MELLRFYADIFYWAGGVFTQTFTQINYSYVPRREDWGEIAKAIRALIEGSGHHDFPLIASQANRVNDAVGGLLEREEFPEISRLLMDLHARIIDELGAVLFLHVPNPKAVIYENPLNGWKPVVARLPSAQLDIEEAGKCFALSRYTATVFHLMRVMEIGLDALMLKLSLPAHLPSWDAKLKKIEDELDRLSSDRTSAEVDFYRQALANYRAVQTAWRNPTMHVEKIYTEEMAAEIVAAVKGFMRHVVQGL